MDKETLEIIGLSAMIAGGGILVFAMMMGIVVMFQDKYGAIGLLLIPFFFFVIGAILYIINKPKE